MRKLLSFKLKALKFADQISGTVREVINDASAAAVELSTNSLTININKVEHAGLSVYAKLMLMSKEAEDYNNKAKVLHNIIQQESNSLGQIQLEVKNGHATEIIEKIKSKLQEPFW